MLDLKTQVVTALNTINIPVRYELFYDGSTAVPCITYSEYLNSDNKTGDSLGYSEVGFTITLWTEEVDEIPYYMSSIDSKLRALGFKRVSSNELVQGNLIRKISDYKCICIEDYN